MGRAEALGFIYHLYAGGEIHSRSLDEFKSALESLLQREQQYPERFGILLILDEDLEMSQRLLLAETLKTASFTDGGNRSKISKNFYSNAYWGMRGGIDVICFPGYTDNREPLPLCYRIFTRGVLI